MIVALAALGACAPDMSLVDVCGGGARATVHIDPTTLPRWGSAREDDDGDDVITLTPREEGRQGSVFDVSFGVLARQATVDFELRIAPGGNADGLALVFLDPARIDDAGLDGVWLAGGGGCLGVGTTVGMGGVPDGVDCGDVARWLPGVAVEIDSWWNEGGDPTDTGGAPVSPHGSYLVDGQVFDPVLSWPLPTLESDTWQRWQVRLDDQHLAVEQQDAIVFEGDLDVVPDFRAFVGFTAATGSLSDEHSVRDVTVTGPCWVPS